MTRLGDPWSRRALAALLLLVLLTPVFGWASAAVGYAEPLGNAAAATGGDATAATSPSVLGGYSVPGLGGGAGTLASALVGTGLTLGVAVGTGRLLER